jgi:hypothetical protein
MVSPTSETRLKALFLSLLGLRHWSSVGRQAVIATVDDSVGASGFLARSEKSIAQLLAPLWTVRVLGSLTSATFSPLYLRC